VFLVYIYKICMSYYCLVESSCFHFRQDKRVKGLLLIWKQTFWTILKTQNEPIFLATNRSVEEVVNIQSKFWGFSWRRSWIHKTM